MYTIVWRKSACAVLLIFAAAEIASAATFKTLVNLIGFNGAYPAAALVQGIDGNLYGTTEGGGTGTACPMNNCGTVFKITPGGTLTTLYSFCTQPNCPDGASPPGGLVQGTDGNFYGTTHYGGIDCGVFGG